MESRSALPSLSCPNGLRHQTVSGIYPKRKDFSRAKFHEDDQVYELIAKLNNASDPGTSKVVIPAAASRYQLYTRYNNLRLVQEVDSEKEQFLSNLEKNGGHCFCITWIKKEERQSLCSNVNPSASHVSRCRSVKGGRGDLGGSKTY